MEALSGGWQTSGSLESRFFVDDGIWKDAPLLTGQTSFEPLPDVKNILVTGGEGFIASWLVRHLVVKYSDAYNVVCFDKLDYCSSLNNARMLEGRPNFKFFHGELTKPSDVLRCLRKYNVDTIFHLAAQSHVDLSFGNSYSFTVNNVVGTHVLLETAVAVKTVKRFYHISTDEVYGEVAMDAADLTEHSILAPTNPYAASKAAAEMYVRAYVQSFQLPVVMIRLNNVYGPHQKVEVIPKFINLLQRGKPLWIHGDGQNTRRYLYAGDAADAFDTILHKGEIGQIYNVDSRDEISNLGLADRLLRRFGVSDKQNTIQHTRDRPFNDMRYAVDGTKLRKLGWSQKVSFEEGLTNTVAWYGKFSGWWGNIENILAPFPEVKHDRNGDIAVEDGLRAEVAHLQQTVQLLQEKQKTQTSSTPQANVGAQIYDPVAAGQPKKLNGGNANAPNGHLQQSNGGVRKRKADALDEE
ncbi:hypothetical protein AC579_7773 [Pseudocercospora musae]|uniref:NAD(P)-binding domain-containing protein n=1 Tax=Pseudocercospora musae TaxID=113226 RepID=A0A139IK36_9PEZI|nr:hypothetical protein AC579_7773 [Pseudocercospora musae]